MPSWPMAMPSSTTMVLELDAVAARRVDDLLDALADGVQVDVAGDELGEAVGDGDDGLEEVLGLHAGGAPEGAGAGHATALGGDGGSVVGGGHSAWSGFGDRMG